MNSNNNHVISDGALKQIGLADEAMKMIASSLNEGMLNYISSTLASLRPALDAISEAIKNRAGEHHYFIETVDRVYNLGWAFGAENDLFAQIYFNPKTFAKLSNTELDALFRKQFNVLNPQGLITELETTSNGDVGYERIINQMCTTLNESKGSWLVLFPQLFALIDRVTTYQLNDHNLETRLYTQAHTINKFKSKLSKDSDDLDEYQYIYLKTLGHLMSLWGSDSFSKDSRKIKFQRNAIQHGRYDSHNLNEVQFSKLVLLYSTLCLFN
ncbi:hypothetical protein AB0Y04_02635 [Loigolactobacillus coryniformis]|uniref:hypothetical protein n=1 Tax=Loigolactobacillus coryniformis TaxID=1610 RepID=UPI00201B197F|nr:hypothetical protein [Loigolactobacillus coryniformis]MCL5457607.1 hypothetical protein [Loigolactobacillus coryniformis]